MSEASSTTGAGAPTSQPSAKSTGDVARDLILKEAEKLLGVKYGFGAEWTDLSKVPEELDCSELVEGVFSKAGVRIPDGSQAQFNFCKPVQIGRPGDLAFFGKSKDPMQVYHVGIVFDQDFMIEARAHEPGRDWTGKVTRRERKAWEGYKNFLGYRQHPDLA